MAHLGTASEEHFGLLWKVELGSSKQHMYMMYVRLLSDANRMSHEVVCW